MFKALLEVADNLERATQIDLGEATKQERALAEKVLEGVDMTLRTMASALGKFKVESFSALESFFDPNFHEAVQQIEDDSVPDGWVTEEFQKGYHQDGRLVRPSMVVVAKGGMSRAEWEALHAPEQEEPEVNDKVVSESETTSESLEPETEAAMANEPENDSSDVTSGDSSEVSATENVEASIEESEHDTHDQKDDQSQEEEESSPD